MALSSITNRVTYIGDATSTVFPFSYDFFSPNDLKVFLWDTVAGVIYPQLLNTNYSISGNLSSQGTYPSGGNVVMASSIPTNLQIVITRSPSFVQNFVLNQNAPINSIGLTSQLDYLTLLVQRLQDEVSRSIGLSDGMGFVNGSTFSPQLPSSICLTSSALQVLQINSGATGFQLISLNASAVAVGSSIIPVTQGGTGQSGALTPGAVWYSINTTTMGNTVAGTAGQYLQSTGAGAPIWVTASSGGGISGSTNLTNQVAGVLPVANGGTNISSLAPQFGVLYASTPTTMGIIPSVTAGLFLQSQGSSAPIWAAAPSGSSGGSFTGSISLTGQVAGILPIANGGTNISTLPFLGSVIWASSATSMGVVPNGSAGQVLQYNGSSAPSWVAQTGGASGSTSLTNQVSGILPTANGGTGATALTPQYGVVYMSSATVASVIPSAQSGFVLTANGSSAPTFQADPNAPVNARYFAASSVPGSNTTPNPIFFLNKDFDSNNAYSGNTYTVQVPGKYQIIASLNQNGGITTTNEAASIYIYRNSSAVSQTQLLFAGATSTVSSFISDIIQCSSGHLIQILAGNGTTTPGILPSNTLNYFSINRIGP